MKKLISDEGGYDRSWTQEDELELERTYGIDWEKVERQAQAQRTKNQPSAEQQAWDEEMDYLLEEAWRTEH